MKRSVVLGGSFLLTVVLAAGVVWLVHRTVQRARESNQRVVHSQGVLAATESVTSAILDAETSVRGYLLGGDSSDLGAYRTASDLVASEVDRLGTLVAASPTQQRRARRLRLEAGASLAALAVMIESKQQGRTIDAAAVDAEQARMNEVRRTLQSIRLEEQRLLNESMRLDDAAARRLELLPTAIVLVAAALLGWVIVLTIRDASRQRRGADSLRRINEELEAQVTARTAALGDSNARLRSIIDSAVDGIIVIDARGRIEAFNPGAERLFGYPEAEVIGRNVNILMPSPYHEEHDGYLRRYLEAGAAKIIGIGREVTGRRRDGTTFPLHLSVGEMLIGGERKFTGMLHDLTERVRLEEELRRSEARWRSIIESAVDGIVVIDAHGRIEAFNTAAERLFGYAEGEVIGRNVNMLMPAPYQEEHDTYLARYLATGRAKIIGIGREVAGRRRDGTTFPLHLSVGEMTVGGARKFTGILHDLTTRVQIEEQMREQAALARLGEMAAVIAHEVKNPLAGVRAAIQVIGSRLPAGSADSGTVAEIVARIDALNELVKDLLLFARTPKPQPAPTDIVPLIAVTADLLKQDPSMQNVQVDIEGSAPAVAVDAEMMKIAFHNLLVNCAHAMKGRGRIRVAIAAAESRCQVAFTDNGPGIPPEVRDRIFTPFFTTKARGSGLGLATAKRLIEAHHGRIVVDCPPAGGTTVTVQLPTQPS